MRMTPEIPVEKKNITNSADLEQAIDDRISGNTAFSKEVLSELWKKQEEVANLPIVPPRYDGGNVGEMAKRFASIVKDHNTTGSGLSDKFKLTTTEANQSLDRQIKYLDGLEKRLKTGVSAENTAAAAELKSLKEQAIALKAEINNNSDNTSSPQHDFKSIHDSLKKTLAFEKDHSFALRAKTAEERRKDLGYTGENEGQATAILDSAKNKSRLYDQGIAKERPLYVKAKNAASKVITKVTPEFVHKRLAPKIKDPEQRDEDRMSSIESTDDALERVMSQELSIGNMAEIEENILDENQKLTAMQKKLAEDNTPATFNETKKEFTKITKKNDELRQTLLTSNNNNLYSNANTAKNFDEIKSVIDRLSTKLDNDSKNFESAVENMGENLWIMFIVVIIFKISQESAKKKLLALKDDLQNMKEKGVLDKIPQKELANDLQDASKKIPYEGKEKKEDLTAEAEAGNDGSRVILGDDGSGLEHSPTPKPDQYGM